MRLFTLLFVFAVYSQPLLALSDSPVHCSAIPYDAFESQHRPIANEPHNVLSVDTSETLTRRPVLAERLPAKVAAQSTDQIDLVGTAEWRGFSSLCYMNGHLFVAAYYGILALDVSNPAVPRLVGRYYDPMELLDCGQEVVGRDGYLYRLLPGVGLQVLDATDPANIWLRMTFPFYETKPCSGYYSENMLLEGDWLYIASSTDTLFAFNVSDPGFPNLWIAFHDGNAVDIGATQGMAAYHVDSKQFVYLSSDWTNTPLTTIELGMINGWEDAIVRNVYWGTPDSLPPYGGKLVRSRNYLLAIGPRFFRTWGPRKDLKVMDLTDPVHPQFACSSYITNEMIVDMEATDTLLYVALYRTLNTYNINDPCAPQLLASVVLDSVDGTGIDLHGTSLKGNQLYFFGVDDESGPRPREFVEVADITSPAQPHADKLYSAHAGEMMNASPSTPLAIASTVQTIGTLRSLNLVEPTTPTPGPDIDGTIGGGFQRGIDIIGSFLYSVGECGCYPTPMRSSLTCIDLSDVENPIYKWHFNMGLYRPVRFWDVAAVPPYFYIAAEDSGLYILHEAVAGQTPQLIATLALPPYASDVAVSPDRAYVVCRGQYVGGSMYEGSYLQVVDISNPATPSTVGTVEPWGHYNVEISGNRLATTAWFIDHWAVSLYNLDATGWPVSAGMYDPPDRQGDIEVMKLSGNYLYAKNGELLDVVDINDPTMPIRVGQYAPLGHIWDVAVKGEFIYMGERYGIKVLLGPSCCEGTTGNLDGKGAVDLSDLSWLIGYMTGGGGVSCYAEADINQSGATDLSDLSMLIAFLLGSGISLPACQ